MKTLNIKAVLMTDGEHYFIHGSDAETTEQMFAAMAPIWKFDPAKELAHVVELSVSVPEVEHTLFAYGSMPVKDVIDPS